MRDLSSNYITDCWSVLRMRHFATHEKICLHLLDWSNLWKSALKLALCGIGPVCGTGPICEFYIHNTISMICM